MEEINNKGKKKRGDSEIQDNKKENTDKV